MKIKKLHLLSGILTFLLGVAIFECVRFLETGIENYFFTNLIELPEQPIVDDRIEESAVYCTLIQHYFDVTTTLVTVEAMSTRCDIYEDNLGGIRQVDGDPFSALRESMSVDKETTNDYLWKNQAPSELSLGSLQVEYRLISKEEIEAFFGEHGKGWESFYKKYPNSSGLIFFSRVGFNRTHDEAFVYLGRSCGGLCGGGGYAFLKKQGAMWIIQKTEPVWIS